jgi:autotransporter-associated beta strand protein
MIVGLNGGNGIYNLSGTGVLTSTERVRVAVGNDAVGNFVQTGGNLAISSGQRLELSEDGGVATYSLSGGTLNVADDILVGGFGTGGTGTFTQTGGLATANRVRVAFSATKTGVVNLNGGVLAANSIEKESGGGTASLNFDGGTAQALSSNGNFITNFTTVDIQAGGATIDTNNFDTGIQSPLSGVGALTKIGLNQLKLAGANTYLGNTIINAGQLTILSSGSLTFDINANGVNNQVTGNGAGSFLVLGAFAFDLTDAASNGTWTVIDYANLSSVTFDPAFTVTGFSNAGGGSWTSGSFTFNQTTGVLTAVPEPATWVLMGSALFIVAIAAHRRRRRLSTTV